MEKEINIVFNIDRNFVQHCAAALNSVIKHYQGKLSIVFFILNSDLTDQDKQNLMTFGNSSQYVIRFVHVEESLLKPFPLGHNTISKEITVSTYFRLFLTDLLPENIEKVIYLDADVVVNDSIDKLWNEDISNFAVAAVPDKEIYQTANKIRLDIPKEKAYFNAGVLILNLTYLREIGFVQKIFDWVSNHKDCILYHDQDILNALLWSKVKYISYKWNMMDCYLYKKPVCGVNYKDIVKSYQEYPSIIHFAGFFKPWNVECMNPHRSLYDKALEGTIWENYKKTRKETNIVRILKLCFKGIIKGSPYYK